MILKSITNPVKTLDKTGLPCYIGRVRCETIHIFKKVIGI